MDHATLSKIVRSAENGIICAILRGIRENRDELISDRKSMHMDILDILYREGLINDNQIEEYNAKFPY